MKAQYALGEIHDSDVESYFTIMFRPTLLASLSLSLVMILYNLEAAKIEIFLKYGPHFYIINEPLRAIFQDYWIAIIATLYIPYFILSIYGLSFYFQYYSLFSFNRTSSFYRINSLAILVKFIRDVKSKRIVLYKSLKDIYNNKVNYNKKTRRRNLILSFILLASLLLLGLIADQHNSAEYYWGLRRREMYSSPKELFYVLGIAYSIQYIFIKVCIFVVLLMLISCFISFLQTFLNPIAITFTSLAFISNLILHYKFLFFEKLINMPFYEFVYSYNLILLLFWSAILFSLINTLTSSFSFDNFSKIESLKEVK